MADYISRENGDYLLQETGDSIWLENQLPRKQDWTPRGGIGMNNIIGSMGEFELTGFR